MDNDHDDVLGNVLGNALDMVYGNGDNRDSEQDVYHNGACHGGTFRGDSFLAGTCLPFDRSFLKHCISIIWMK